MAGMSPMAGMSLIIAAGIIMSDLCLQCEESLFSRIRSLMKKKHPHNNLDTLTHFTIIQFFIKTCFNIRMVSGTGGSFVCNYAFTSSSRTVASAFDR